MVQRGFEDVQTHVYTLVFSAGAEAGQPTCIKTGAIPRRTGASRCPYASREEFALKGKHVGTGLAQGTVPTAPVRVPLRTRFALAHTDRGKPLSLRVSAAFSPCTSASTVCVGSHGQGQAAVPTRFGGVFSLFERSCSAPPKLDLLSKKKQRQSTIIVGWLDT